MKEMFAPTMHAEVRQQIRPTSFEPVFGIPMLYPLLDGDAEQSFQLYRRMLRQESNMSKSDLHLNLLAGSDHVIEG